MPKLKRPSYLLHKPTGQARCRIGGKDFYLGEFNSPESKARYNKHVADWLAKQGPNAGLIIEDLALQFLDHADSYYRHPDGTATGETRNLKDALEPLVMLFGQTPVVSFGPRRLKMVRDEMIRRGMCRTNVNRQLHRVRRLFSWGVENELVDANLYVALKQVRPLAPGRTEAVETEPVQPVTESVVNATLPHLTTVLQAMVRLQLLTGARPAEICMMRPCDVTIRTDGLWSYRPHRHKTAWKGKVRTILIGPQAQDLLRPFLERATEAHCFSPAESEAERSATRRAARRTPLTPSHRARTDTRQLSDRYVKDSYGKAIRRACRLRLPAELRAPRGKKRKESKSQMESRLRRVIAWERENVWSPNRLRHLRATLIRENYGLEAASAVLGHSGLKITETYARRNDKAAAEVMRQIG
jgi:integrase